MELTQAIKEVKTINRFLDQHNYSCKKSLIYQIKHYNYVNDEIIGKMYINIALKELERNNYKYDEINRKIKSYYGKRKRIKERIKRMNKNNIWFGTYTINDDSINKNHSRKIKELLKGLNYIVNVDYGAKNGRKHYHAIIESKEEPMTWQYGFCKFIKIQNIDKQAISKYLTKITNHTIKDTAEKIIYSRN